MTADLPSNLAQRLAAHSPAETNSLVASSVRQCGVTLEEATDVKFSYEKPDGTIVPTRYVKFWTARAGSHSQIDAAREKLAYAMRPAERGQVLGWLAELSVITARRADDDATEDLRAAAYSNRLSDYPADVVREALLVRRWKFFPTWLELGDACDEIVKPRKQMQAALDQAEWEVADRERRARALPDQDAVTLTPDEQAERRAKTAERMADLVAGLRAATERETRENAERVAAARASYEQFRGAAE